MQIAGVEAENDGGLWIDQRLQLPAPFGEGEQLFALGGLVIGLIETFWSAYFTIEYKDVAAFSMLAIVLIFFPTGLLGRPEVEKV